MRSILFNALKLFRIEFLKNVSVGFCGYIALALKLQLVQKIIVLCIARETLAMPKQKLQA